MKIKDLRGMNEQEMKMKLEDLYKDLMRENAQVATGTVPKNPGKLKNVKKTIARIMTILAEKEVKPKA